MFSGYAAYTLVWATGQIDEALRQNLEEGVGSCSRSETNESEGSEEGKRLESDLCTGAMPIQGCCAFVFWKTRL
jgi:hypothetical protein